VTRFRVRATAYLLKVGYEVLAPPITYFVIARLKAAERADAFDRGENFNPFRFRPSDDEGA
jgi:hypothetical protein